MKDWSQKCDMDIVGDIGQAVKGVRDQPPIKPIHCVNPGNWELLKEAGYIPQHLTSWNEVEAWVDNLPESGEKP